MAERKDISIVATCNNLKAVIRPGKQRIAGTAVPEIRSKIHAAITSGARDLVLDLADVHMLDSRGIALLISTHNSLSRLSGSLTVTHVSADITDLLHVLRVDRHLILSAE